MVVKVTVYVLSYRIVMFLVVPVGACLLKAE